MLWSVVWMQSEVMGLAKKQKAVNKQKILPMDQNGAPPIMRNGHNFH